MFVLCGAVLRAVGRALSMVLKARQMRTRNPSWTGPLVLLACGHCAAFSLPHSRLPAQFSSSSRVPLPRLPHVALPPSAAVRAVPKAAAAIAVGGEADDERQRRRRTLTCCYGALCSLICVKAVVAQALPLMLVELMAQPERVAESLSTVAAGSAALEFLLLPAVAALSDTHGRRPLLLALPLLTVLLRMMVLVHSCLHTLLLSRVVVGALVNYFDAFCAVTAADLFSDDAEALASLEGKTAAAWGAAYAGGMLIGGRLLARGASALPATAAAGGGAAAAGAAAATATTTLRASGVWAAPWQLAGPFGAYAVSVGFALLALLFACGARETLPPARRARFSLRGSNPLGFLRLFRNGRLLAAFSAILALQTLHDGEGDVWQVYGADVHGWGTRQASLYGAAVGLASTAGGLLTGRSVRRLGTRAHTVLFVSSEGASNNRHLRDEPARGPGDAGRAARAARGPCGAGRARRAGALGAWAGGRRDGPVAWRRRLQTGRWCIRRRRGCVRRPRRASEAARPRRAARAGRPRSTGLSRRPGRGRRPLQ